MKENEAFSYMGKMSLFENLLESIMSITQEEWLDYKKRKTAGGAAAENTDTIPLVYDLKHRLNSSIFHKNYERFSVHVDDILLSTKQHIGEVKVQQAMLTRLRAGTVIPRHRDRGPLTTKTHRIHVPVATNTRCIFRVGDESMNLKIGEIWVIDNVNRYHSVENLGNTDRIHLIIDAI